MANRFLGEATTEACGKTWTLRCDFNAMVAFEDLSDKDALATFQAYEEKGEVGIKDMVYMMLAFLRRHHPETTLLEAGDILSEDVDAISRVILAASPTVAEVGAVGKSKVRKSA